MRRRLPIMAICIGTLLGIAIAPEIWFNVRRPVPRVVIVDEHDRCVVVTSPARASERRNDDLPQRIPIVTLSNGESWPGYRRVTRAGESPISDFRRPKLVYRIWGPWYGVECISISVEDGSIPVEGGVTQSLADSVAVDCSMGFLRSAETR